MTLLKMDRQDVIVLCILILAGLVSSCGVGTDAPIITQTAAPPFTLEPTAPGNNCAPEDITLFINQADHILQQFDALGTLVDTTPPADLLPLIQEMDALAKTMDTFIQIPCVLKAQAALSEYFGLMIQGHMRVYAGALEITSQADRTARDEFLAATDKLALFNKLSLELSRQAEPDNPTE